MCLGVWVGVWGCGGFALDVMQMEWEGCLRSWRNVKHRGIVLERHQRIRVIEYLYYMLFLTQQSVVT